MIRLHDKGIFQVTQILDFKVVGELQFLFGKHKHVVESIWIEN